MKRYLKNLLILAGISNILVGVLHIGILLIGASAFSYLGAPASLTLMAKNHQLIPLLCIMIPLAGLFCLAGLYALSAAQVIRQLPATKIVTLVIGLIYCLRGAVVVLWPFPSVVESLMHRYPELLGMGRPILWQDWMFSLVWLMLGLIYMVGWYSIRHSQQPIQTH